MLRVYTASKLKHAPMAGLVRLYPHLQFHARWLKHNSLERLDTPEHAVEFWLQDEQDVLWDADAVLVMAEGDDHLRGRLSRLAWLSPTACLSSWWGGMPITERQHHPGVTRMDDLASALLI